MPNVNTDATTNLDQLQTALQGNNDKQLRADNQGQMRSKLKNDGGLRGFLTRGSQFDRAAAQVEAALKNSTGLDPSAEVKRLIRRGVEGKLDKPAADMLKDVRDAYHQEGAEKYGGAKAVNAKLDSLSHLMKFNPEGRQFVQDQVKTETDRLLDKASREGKTLTNGQIQGLCEQATVNAASDWQTKQTLARQEVKDVKELQAGKKGQVYKVTFSDDSSAVIKLQADDPTAAIIGTRLMQDAGVNAPDISEVNGPRQGVLMNSMAKLANNADAQKLAAELGNPARQYQQVVEMDFAEGESFGNLTKTPEIKAVLTNPQFQSQLGQIMAADTFTGNPDRLFAKPKTYGSDKLEGWYNPGNLVISGQGKDLKVSAIDNEFKPGQKVGGNDVWGFQSPYGQWGSVAAASPEHFEQEVNVVLDRMISEANKPANLNGRTPVTLTDQERQQFVQNVKKSGADTMGQMLEHGQERKKQLQSLGADSTLIDKFTEHKRALRLLGNEGPQAGDGATKNLSVKDKLGMAQHRDQYRQHMGKAPKLS